MRTKPVFDPVEVVLTRFSLCDMCTHPVDPLSPSLSESGIRSNRLCCSLWLALMQGSVRGIHFTYPSFGCDQLDLSSCFLAMFYPSSPRVRSGFGQGCSIPPFLFNFVIGIFVEIALSSRENSGIDI